MSLWITTTDTGAASVTVPEALTAADVSDLKEWFALILRTLKKRTLAADGGAVSRPQHEKVEDAK